MLIGSWILVLAMLPFLAFGIYLVIYEPSHAEGYLYIVGTLLLMYGLYRIVVIAMPENMAGLLTGPTRTTVYDGYFKGTIFENVAKTYFPTDTLVVLWVFCGFPAFFSLTYAVYLVSVYPDELSWLDFAMLTTFALGSFLLLYSAYYSFFSTVGFDVLFCRAKYR